MACVRYLDADSRTQAALSFGFECEVGGGRRAPSYCDLLVLRAIAFLPSRDCVTSGRHILNGVGTIFICRSVWTLHDREIAAHPGVDIALHVDHFRSLPTLRDGRGPWGLRLIPRNITGKSIRLGVDVVGRLIARLHLEILANI